MKQVQQRALNASVATETALPDLTTAKGNRFVDLGFVSGSQAGTGNTDEVMDFGQAFGDAITGATNAYKSTDAFKQAAERDAINGRAAGKLFAQQERNAHLKLFAQNELEHTEVPSRLLSKQHEAIAMQGDFSSYYSNAFTDETKKQFEVLTNQSFEDAHQTKVRQGIANIKQSDKTLVEKTASLQAAIPNPEMRNKHIGHVASTHLAIDMSAFITGQASYNTKMNRTVGSVVGVRNGEGKGKDGVLTEYATDISLLIKDHPAESDRQIATRYLAEKQKLDNPVETLAATIATIQSLTTSDGVKLLDIYSQTSVALNNEVIKAVVGIQEYNTKQVVEDNPNEVLDFHAMTAAQIKGASVFLGQVMNGIVQDAFQTNKEGIVGVESNDEIKAHLTHLDILATHEKGKEYLSSALYSQLAPLNEAADVAIATNNTADLVPIIQKYTNLQGKFRHHSALQNMVKAAFLKLNPKLADAMLLAQSGILTTSSAVDMLTATQVDSGTKKKKLQVTANSVHTAMLKEGSGYAQFNEDELLMYADRVASVYHYLEVNGRTESVATLVDTYRPKRIQMDAADIGQPEGFQINVPIQLDASLGGIRNTEEQYKGALAQGILEYARDPEGVLQSAIRASLTRDKANTMLTSFRNRGQKRILSEKERSKVYTEYNLLGEHIEGINIVDDPATEGAYSLVLKHHGTSLRIRVSEIWLRDVQTRGKTTIRKHVESNIARTRRKRGRN